MYIFAVNLPNLPKSALQNRTLENAKCKINAKLDTTRAKSHVLELRIHATAHTYITKYKGGAPGVLHFGNR